VHIHRDDRGNINATRADRLNDAQPDDTNAELSRSNTVSSNIITPSGVQGTNPPVPVDKRPTFTG
jgi:hypothetical protein